MATSAPIAIITETQNTFVGTKLCREMKGIHPFMNTNYQSSHRMSSMQALAIDAKDGTVFRK